jgi:pyruvate/2-oxoglutarate dehydrogenase complex dihydrolipoamide acyltransferase (E2) component
MNGRDTSSQRSGAVMLTRDVVLASWLGYLCAPSVRVVSVASGYEAAAEILASPAEILVIDFRAMSSTHQRLLDTARGLGMQILGMGKVPSDISPEALSRVRLVSQADLPEALREALSLGAAAPQTGAAAASASAAAPAGAALQARAQQAAPIPSPPATKPAAVAADRPAEPARRRPARRARLVPKPAAGQGQIAAQVADGTAKAEPLTHEPQAQATAQAPTQVPAPPPPRQPSDLLTPEEVAALLESDL